MVLQSPQIQCAYPTDLEAELISTRSAVVDVEENPATRIAQVVEVPVITLLWHAG